MLSDCSTNVVFTSLCLCNKWMGLVELKQRTPVMTLTETLLLAPSTVQADLVPAIRSCGGDLGPQRKMRAARNG